MLFVGFSSFLIAAALLLVGLLFRLNIDRRAEEFGILMASGYRLGTLRRLLLLEGGLLALVGVIIGTVLATAYAALLVRFLAAIWPGGALHSFLGPHVTALSLLIGGVSSLVVSLLTIAWSVRALGRLAPTALLAGRTSDEDGVGYRPSRWWTISAVGIVLLSLGLSVSGIWVQDNEARAGTFFSGGFLFLVGCLLAAYAWMRGSQGLAVAGHGLTGIAKLGVRNAARHPMRSLLTAGLLAAAAFVVVAVEAFRRTADVADNSINSPSGGFSLLAESDLPIFLDFTSEKGREEVGGILLLKYRAVLRGDNTAAEKQVREALESLRKTTIVAFRVHAGDDASCRNLYQPRRPRILGVPQTLIKRGGFRFTEVLAKDSQQTRNSWELLESDKEGGISAFGENNTVVWMLKKGLGQKFAVTKGDGDEQNLLIAGLLQDSVFQSGLLVSAANFLRMYQGHE
ncbi:MAG: FtsX-like permease family protein, partial [Candidatus Acidiferrum sp.]